MTVPLPTHGISRERFYKWKSSATPAWPRGLDDGITRPTRCATTITSAREGFATTENASTASASRARPPVDFANEVIRRLPSRVQLVQTDNGSATGTSRSSIPPRANPPRLNDKVERSHRIDNDERYRLLAVAPGVYAMSGSSMSDAAHALRPRIFIATSTTSTRSVSASRHFFARGFVTTTCACLFMST